MAYGFDPDVPGVSPSGVSSEPAFAGMSPGESYSYGGDPVSVAANVMGLSPQQYQDARALDPMQTSSGLTREALGALSAKGFGDMPVSPTQTADQARGALNFASALNTAAPYFIQAIPGVNLALTGIQLAQGRGFGAFNPFSNFDMIREAVNRNQMELQLAQQSGAGVAQPSYGGTTGGEGGDSTPTPTISPTLGNIPGGAAGLSTGLPGGRGYSGTAAGQVGAAGALGNLGEEEDEEERARKQATGLFSTSKTFAEGGMVGPGGMPMFGGMPDPNRVTPAAGLREQPMAAPMNPQIAGMQARQFAQQNPQQIAEIRQEIMEALQSGELQPQSLNMLVQLAQVVSQNPDMYPYARNFLIQQDILDEDDLPPQFDPAVQFIFDVVAEAARGVSGSAPAAAGTAPPVASMAKGGTVPDSKKPSGGVVIEAHEGEYVIPKHIVLQKGTDFFDKLIGKDVKAERSAA